MRLFSVLAILFFLGITSCNSSESSAQDSSDTDSLELVLDAMFKAHGSLGNYQFDFRDNSYSFRFDRDHYTYTKTVETDSTLQVDELDNDGFSRTINGETVSLTEEEMDKYSESLNSVVYFVCLPLKLNDPAVNISLKNPVSIHGTFYDVLEVSFDEAGGGKDFEDIFRYWVNRETHQLDYLAYQYAVNGGGVRFRAAYNSRMVGEMRFQDYVNYGAEVGTPLEELPALYEQNQLDELSRIVSENVVPLSD